MSELIPYVKLLSERGLAVGFRELKARFIREDPKKAIRRLMDSLERRGARFTFFLVGVCAEDNPDFTEEILSRGHEIACHGYEHKRFNLMSPSEIRRDLETALNLFEKRFGYKLRGFRAPYLGMADHVYPILKEMGFTYSSSVEGEPGAVWHPSGIAEFPISVDDWRILIKENRGSSGLYDEMRSKARPGACYLLHPWRVGQGKYMDAMERFLDESAPTTSFPAMSDMADGAGGIAISGDVGELSLMEIFRRSLKIS